MAIGIYTTVASDEDARALARAALDRRLCACVHLEPIESLYRWKGELCEDREVRILFKTIESRRGALEALIAGSHGYETPAIWTVRFDAVDPAYAAWIESEAGG
ncbi:divalent-cation tolerance protein CutA [Cereibacter sphaeroides]|uniref:divalent-cation tolerance protein CutA n=1 Tax=Cereibacter sphaeroides TaxID=1063 RepID=UPI001F2FB3BE|nr:divalent-cation tolerance protein CutA [Cereibacter sphaeroides]MCE6951300.1 divalent-cation tolerance protein CutA [Cereibacter sphaeroides]